MRATYLSSLVFPAQKLIWKKEQSKEKGCNEREKHFYWFLGKDFYRSRTYYSAACLPKNDSWHFSFPCLNKNKLDSLLIAFALRQINWLLFVAYS
jgi:hypothetical protein